MVIDQEQIEQKYNELIAMAEQMMSDVDDARHSWGHITDVVENMVEIIKLLPNDMKINIEACILSAYWHDVGRKIRDEGHGEISANMLKDELELQGYDKGFIDTCYNTIAFHTINVHAIENNIIPETTEGKILRDADKIGFVGTGRWQNSIYKRKKFVSILNSIFKVRNEMLLLDVSKDIWDKKVLELIVFLHNKLFEEM